MLLNFAFLTLCLAAGTFARTIENGFATRFYTTGQPPSCNIYNTDPALTVAISSMFNLTSLCQTWVVITKTGDGNNGGDANDNSIRATVTNTCFTCNESDLSLGSTWYNGLLFNASNNQPGAQPTRFGIEWYFCDGKNEC